MSLVRWDPFRELDEMNSRFARLLGRTNLAQAPAASGNDSLMALDWVPSVDIAETPEEFQITAELPQVKREDVHVSVDDRTLRIEGERKAASETKDKKFHRVERSYGSFLRTFALPDNVDGDKVKAEFKDGVLEVHLPKTTKATPKSKTIEIL